MLYLIRSPFDLIMGYAIVGLFIELIWCGLLEKDYLKSPDTGA